MLPIGQIARTCHEVNRAYCEAIGDASQVSWEEADQWQRGSAVMGVKAMIANPDGTPEDSHKNWLAHKEAEGWTYGPVKDPATKQHPCMVPYDQLPIEQRMKDHLFIAVVRSFQ